MRADPESLPAGGTSRSVEARTSAVSFAARLDAHGSALALVDADGEPVTYQELAARVGTARELLGTARRLVLMEASHTVETVTTYLAALGGGHPVLLVPPGDADRTAALSARYDPDAVHLAGDELRPRRARSAHQLHPDLALLLSTSGSTGSPKLVRLSRHNVESNAAAIAGYLELTSEDRAITSLPLHYCYGLSVLHSHLHVGGAVALTDTSVVDSCFWRRFGEVGVTGLAGVPHTFDLLDRVGFEHMELPTLRYLTQAGGRLSPEKVRRHAAHAEAHGRRFYVMYGQTEATARMAYLPPEHAQARPGAIGRAIPGGSFRIDAAPGDESGELVYSGPNVMLGYAQGPADLSLGRTVHELRTGDLARVGDDGLVEIVGRASRFIKPFGVRVDLDEVESLLAAQGFPSVCTGDDEALVVALEVSDPAAAPVTEIREVLRSSLGLPPARVHVCGFSTLPRLTSGKPDLPTIRAEALRRHETGSADVAEASTCAPATGSSSGLVRAAYAEILGLTRIEDEDTFASLGGDSLSYVEASLRLERELGYVPRDWHVTPVGQLDALQPRRRTRWRPWRHIETNVALRAVAIVLIVGTHSRLFWQQGGAHLLFGLAGFNFARFQLAGEDGGTRRRVASIGRVVLPTLALTVLAMNLREGFTVANLLLVQSYVSTEGRWWYWYVEALVQVLAVLTLLFALPAARRLERAHPFAVPLVLLVPLLGVRFEVLPAGDLAIPTIVAHVIAWLFVLGWLAQRAVTVPQRLLVSALVLASVPGTFESGSREVVVAVGLLLAMWVPQLVVPTPLHRLAGVLAGASLYVYLTHFFIYREVRDTHGSWSAFAASIGLGIGTWLVVERGRRWVIDPLRAWLLRQRGRPVRWPTPDATPSM